MSLQLAEPRRLQRYQPLVVILTAACVGIFADRQAWSLMPHSFELWWCLAAATLATWFVLSSVNRRSAAVVAILISVAAVGGAWHHARWNLFADDDLGRFATPSPQPVCLEAIAEKRRARCRSRRSIRCDRFRPHNRAG